MREYINSVPLNKILEEHSYADDFFASIGIQVENVNTTLETYLNTVPDGVLEDCGMDREQIMSHFALFLQKMQEIKVKSRFSVKDITVIGGHDKAGNKENTQFTLSPGEVVCIVGPTGSGKSRLLADIECLAQRDTPTGRQILLNGDVPPQEKRFSIEYKLVAQLSQNMNFIMDLSAGEFVTMHAESRLAENIEDTVDSIVACANELAGEPFSIDTPVTALSGGQSRALMIADTALLSVSPIVLIDEIENAGVDRRKALELLVKEEKIVLMSTHDPILALMGNKRLVIKNGGVSKIVETSPNERANLEMLQAVDSKLVELRNMLRLGEKIDFDVGRFLTI